MKASDLSACHCGFVRSLCNLWHLGSFVDTLNLFCTSHSSTVCFLTLFKLLNQKPGPLIFPFFAWFSGLEDNSFIQNLLHLDWNTFWVMWGVSGDYLFLETVCDTIRWHPLLFVINRGLADTFDLPAFWFQWSPGKSVNHLRTIVSMRKTRIKVAKYRIKKHWTCSTTLFRCKLWVDVSLFSPHMIN